VRRWTRALPILALAATALAVAPPADAGTPPALSLSATSPVDYGSVAVGESLPRTFTVTNRGGTSTASLKVALTGTAFTIAAGGDLCTAVALGPKKSCAVTVTYTPAAAGAHDSATLTISSKKPAASASLNLTGVGLGGMSAGCAALNTGVYDSLRSAILSFSAGEAVTVTPGTGETGSYGLDVHGYSFGDGGASVGLVAHLGPVTSPDSATYTFLSDGTYDLDRTVVAGFDSVDSWSWSCVAAQ
jgi:hypothetical protein